MSKMTARFDVTFINQPLLPLKACRSTHTPFRVSKRRPSHGLRQPCNVKANLYVNDASGGGVKDEVPVLILPGLGNSSQDYVALAQSLIQRGHSAVAVAPVARWEWGLNAQGFVKLNYWLGTLEPNQVLSWYMRKIKSGLDMLQEVVGDGNVCMVGHSAGGWLGRVYIADHGARVSTLVTLGTPNVPPANGGFDQTRGLLRYVENECDLRGKVNNVVSVAGSGVLGKPLGKGNVAENVAYWSYLAVCGNGEVDGDGVTPVQAAFIDGAHKIVVPQCKHSMIAQGNWYGSAEAMEKWCQFLE